ncbi:related to YCS4-subunit of condensin protein complex [Ustilago bromivora]|uniref:Related to YCS4-subunit of condensin protein complex n=1 Tax=Ustilago bromivora TaxID=307758 RepID=A0A1K0HDU4_9BASI|nr:related to YCS4-subunit of condensin protein complex [Ustilago bromivora]
MTSQDDAGGGSSGRYNLADELLLLQDEPYIIPQETAVEDMNAYEQISTLDTAIDAITNSPDNVATPEIYDLIRSYLKHFANLCPNACNKLLDVIASGMSNALDEAQRELDGDDPNAYSSHAETLERYAFLLQSLVSVAEKYSGARADNRGSAAAIVAARGGRRGAGAKSAAAKSGSAKADAWAWPNSIPAVLALMSKAARENESYLKVQAIKLGIFKVICQAVKAHGQAFSAQTSIMQSLQYYEHLAEPMAELLAVMRLEFDYERLGEEVLREVAAKNFGAMDTKSPRSFGRFLVRMAELSPRSVLKQISLLQKHLDSESYPMRNALIETLGLLIKELALTDDSLNADGNNGGNSDETMADENRGSAEARKKQIETFFDLLIERFLDLNSYVRSKLITVCSRLLDLPTKFPKQRTEITDMVVRHLQDKSSGVRKNAIALLTKLILTHPFGMLHGGELSLQEWQKRFDIVSKELEQTEGSLNLPGEHSVDQDGESEADDEEMDDDNEDDQGSDEQDGDDTVMQDEDDEDEDASPARSRKSKVKKEIAKPKAKKGRRSAVDLQALAAAQAEMEPVDAEKVMRLRLTKRYYADAIAFITQLETAMPNLTLLLASTNKAEVLESMEFFRVAYEYKLSGAAAGVEWQKSKYVVPS